MVHEKFSRPLSVFTTVEGQIRHRRKLCKVIFFLDVLQHDGEKVQVHFRCDDESMTLEAVQDAYRKVRPGHTVRIKVGYTTDPSEAENKPYKVWQSDGSIDVIVPFQDPNGKPFVADVPLATTQPKLTVRRWDDTEKLKSDLFCKYWLNQRECIRMADCPFQHPVGEAYEKARETWVNERLMARRITNHDPNDPHTAKRGHSLRAMVFAQWIRTTFGSILKDGAQVLDVAGGKGDVSMFLSHGYGIPTTVIEPSVRKQPRHWHSRIMRLVSAHFPQPDDSKQTPRYMATMLDDRFLTEQHQLLESTGLLVGLHADQATEPIVDAALKLGKPFAVIPCCVFGHENRGRRLLSGASVVTTEDLVQYLCEKDTGGKGTIRKAYLEFEGKNVVVYWDLSS